MLTKYDIELVEIASLNSNSTETQNIEEKKLLIQPL